MPWWLDKPQRDAERQVREQARADLAEAARAAGIDKHAALRAARASASQLLRYTYGAGGTWVDVQRQGYGGVLGGKHVDEFCYRFTVDRRSTRRAPRVEAATRPQATERIGEAAEKTREALAAATTGGPLTRQQARPAVDGDLSALWSFRRSGGETIVIADYIALTRTGEVEAAECAQFHIVGGPGTHRVTLRWLPQCPPL